SDAKRRARLARRSEGPVKSAGGALGVRNARRRRHRRRHGSPGLSLCRGRRGARRALALLVGRQFLLLLPFLPDLVLLLRRELAQVLVLLARGLPLRRRELGPGLHL